MIQAFFSSSSGMRVQQENIDVISNNISNANTPGYRIKRAEFKELFDAQLNSITNATKTIGHGIKITKITEEPLPEDINPYSLITSNEGYFVVADANGNRFYTKDGDFVSLKENGRSYLATKSNQYVLDVKGNRIELNQDPEQFIVTDGFIFNDGNSGEAGIMPNVVNFSNVAGLRGSGTNQFIETVISGAPTTYKNVSISSGYAEELATRSMSNQMNEMTKLIQTQMAYQLNSKALQTADEMEGMANHLRG